MELEIEPIQTFRLHITIIGPVPIQKPMPTDFRCRSDEETVCTNRSSSDGMEFGIQLNRQQ
ncbi:unnamed protein product, partial [Nesidiocoris tenuis]